jgi:putative transposase
LLSAYTELILAARGIVVSYESIREWGLRFGRIFANMLKRRRSQPGDKWYMDEVFIRIRGKQHYLWRAVDQDGKCPRHPGPEPTQRHRGQTVLPQAAEGLAVCSAGDRHRQAPELRRHQTQDPAERRAPPKPVSQ